jgi:hypothetical protein
VRGDEADERLAVAVAEREPADHAQQEPVVDERRDRQGSEREAAREREQRHLDVVDEHLGGEHGSLAGAEVAPLRRRIRRRGELARHQADRGAGIGQPPHRTRRRGREQQRPRERDHARPLGEAPPVAAREERAHAPAPGAPPVDDGAPARDERLQPRHHRIAGEAAAGVREVRGRAPVQRSELEHSVRAEAPAAATPAGAPQQGFQPGPVGSALRLETL